MLNRDLGYDSEPSAWRDRAEVGKRPGKFEGEANWVVAFYDRMLEGDGEIVYSDGDGWSVTGFVLDPADDYDRRIIAEAFGNPPLNGKPPYGVMISERSDGFVEGSIYAEDHYQATVRHLEQQAVDAEAEVKAADSAEDAAYQADLDAKDGES